MTYGHVCYLQREGICIRSRIAPVLCEIFLAQLDSLILDTLEDLPLVNIFRYVDDFLVLVHFEPGDSLHLLANSI